MKLSDILVEMPYLHPGEMSRIMLDGSISLSAIKREYNHVGEIDQIKILIDSRNTHVIGIDLTNRSPDDRIIPVFQLTFKTKHDVKFNNHFKNILQVDKVAINPSYGNKSIISSVYKLLVNVGYTIVSDNTQFETAQSLWKKIASDSVYTVFVADVEHGLFKDENGIPIKYDGTNILDQDIWSIGSDFSGQYRVMILTKEK